MRDNLAHLTSQIFSHFSRICCGNFPTPHKDRKLTKFSTNLPSTATSYDLAESKKIASRDKNQIKSSC